MEAAMTETPLWDKTRHADRRPLLLARNRIQAGLRAWLAGEGFTEVDVAAMQVSPGNEAHLHGFATEAIGNDGQARRLYLHTSPEFAMKKLLAAGEQRIHAFSHVWRNRERGVLHEPEFTMLEWYRVGEPYEVLMQDCAEMLNLAADITGATEFRFRGQSCNPRLPPHRLSVAEAFDIYAKIDILSTIPSDGPPSVPAMAAQMRQAGMTPSPDDTWSDMLSKILVAKIEPHLGHGRPTILDRYPAAEAALARRAADDARVAERFELYACGVELANGFGELTNAQEQRRRFEIEMSEKARVYGETYPLDEDFLSALASMPAASGIALGFDRLVMLATGAPRISDVIWVPSA